MHHIPSVESREREREGQRGKDGGRKREGVEQLVKSFSCCCGCVWRPSFPWVGYPASNQHGEYFFTIILYINIYIILYTLRLLICKTTQTIEQSTMRDARRRCPQAWRRCMSNSELMVHKCTMVKGHIWRCFGRIPENGQVNTIQTWIHISVRRTMVVMTLRLATLHTTLRLGLDFCILKFMAFLFGDMVRRARVC